MRRADCDSGPFLFYEALQSLFPFLFRYHRAKLTRRSRKKEDYMRFSLFTYSLKYKETLCQCLKTYEVSF